MNAAAAVRYRLMENTSNYLLYLSSRVVEYFISPRNQSLFASSSSQKALLNKIFLPVSVACTFGFRAYWAHSQRSKGFSRSAEIFWIPSCQGLWFKSSFYIHMTPAFVPYTVRIDHYIEVRPGGQ